MKTHEFWVEDDRDPAKGEDWTLEVEFDKEQLQYICKYSCSDHGKVAYESAEWPENIDEAMEHFKSIFWDAIACAEEPYFEI